MTEQCHVQLCSITQGWLSSGMVLWSDRSTGSGTFLSFTELKAKAAWSRSTALAAGTFLFSFSFLFFLS